MFTVWVIFQFGLTGWFTGYTLGCQEVDYSNSPKALRVSSEQLYYTNKFEKNACVSGSVFFSVLVKVVNIQCEGEWPEMLGFINFCFSVDRSTFSVKMNDMKG